MVYLQIVEYSFLLAKTFCCSHNSIRRMLSHLKAMFVSHSPIELYTLSTIKASRQNERKPNSTQLLSISTQTNKQTNYIGGKIQTSFDLYLSSWPIHGDLWQICLNKLFFYFSSKVWLYPVE